MKVDVNSFLAIVAVKSFEILALKKSFSNIFLMLGLLDGSLMSMSANKSLRFCEYVDGIAGYYPLKIFSTSPFIEFASKAWRNVTISYKMQPSDHISDF